jgi:DNA-binding IclR family transcriptional regulator
MMEISTEDMWEELQNMRPKVPEGAVTAIEMAKIWDLSRGTAYRLLTELTENKGWKTALHKGTRYWWLEK